MYLTNYSDKGCMMEGLLEFHMRFLELSFVVPFGYNYNRELEISVISLKYYSSDLCCLIKLKIFIAYKICKVSNETDFLFTKVFIFSNINVISFKIVPLGSYTPMETLFLFLVAALGVFNWYELQCFVLLDRIINEQDSFSRVITRHKSWIF